MPRKAQGSPDGSPWKAEWKAIGHKIPAVEYDRFKKLSEETGISMAQLYREQLENEAVDAYASTMPIIDDGTKETIRYLVQIVAGEADALEAEALRNTLVFLAGGLARVGMLKVFDPISMKESYEKEE